MLLRSPQVSRMNRHLLNKYTRFLPNKYNTFLQYSLCPVLVNENKGYTFYTTYSLRLYIRRKNTVNVRLLQLILQI